MNKNKLTSYLVPKSIIVTIILTTLIVNAIKSCPLVVCTCKWKGGKRKVECVNKNLTSLLTNIDPDTQVLDYSKNPLQTLTHRVFEGANLVNLQKLYLSECQIAEIQEHSFRALSNLIELDLANNMLTSIPSNTFEDYPLLMKLILSGNPIRLLKYEAFSRLKYLSTLDLSDCQIESVESHVFRGLQKLEWLKLDGNKLKNLKYPETMPEVTGGLSLHRNPWTCDCHLRPFHTWLVNVLKNKSAPIAADLICEAPLNYRGSSIAQLKINDLACTPSVIPSSLFVEINEGKNISFVCQVNAVPEAEISWEFEGNPVSSNSSFVYPFYKYYAEEATTEQASELFVFDAKKENNGTYRCTATNIAGKSTSNYTLKVISTQKEMPQTTTSSHFHIIVSSVGTLLIVTIIALFFIICLAYFHKKKPAASRTTENKRTNVKPEVNYEIIKLDETGTPCKTDNIRNPDLIINAEGTTSNKLENCEHLLLLPGDINQTYLTLAGTGTLLNTTAVYEDRTQLTTLGNTAAGSTGTIKLYLSPNTDKNIHNVYVNPFETYDNSMEENYWTIHLLKNANEKQHVLINCCNQTSHQVVDTSRHNALNEDVVNLRHNLEGYPYPSKLKLSPIKDEELAGTPILSPPDPFKTNVTIGVDLEKSN